MAIRITVSDQCLIIGLRISQKGNGVRQNAEISEITVLYTNPFQRQIGERLQAWVLFFDRGWDARQAAP